VHVVHVVPRRLLQPRIDLLEARHQVHVDRLHALAGDEPHARVARRRDEVEAALVHQRHHLVGRAGGLHVHLARVFFSKSVTQSKFLSVAPRSM
jgi:hypothetical protein